MTTSLTQGLIETVIESLPIQNRTMIRLLLLQYFDVSQEDINYMAEDQPDSRFSFGEQPAKKASIEGAAMEVANRVRQYRTFFHQRRERPWLQIECLRKQITLTELAASTAETLLSARFGVDSDLLQARKNTAFSALPKPEIRPLEKAWEREEIAEEEFQKKRLLVEFQTRLRFRERHRRRLTLAQREFERAGTSPLQDHEIAHIWGIPLGSLAGRKVKALVRYLTALQAKLDETNPLPDPNPTGQRPDLWRETIQTLSKKPVEKSVVSFNGIEKTEEALMEKLRAFATDSLPEGAETPFWVEITRIRDAEGEAWGDHARSIFALQRLSAIQTELESTPEDVERDLLALVNPKQKQEMLPEPDEQPVELSEQGLGILQALIGEQDDKRRN